MSRETLDADLLRPVTVTPYEVADRIHQGMYGKGSEHCDIHSCPCDHLAKFYLGMKDSTGLFWPDEKGKNKWKV